MIADIFDIHSIIHHITEFRNYSCILTICYIHSILKAIKGVQFKSFIYNKYISRSLIRTHSQKLNYAYTSQYKSVISLYLFGISNNCNQCDIKRKLKTIERKELEYYIKSFNYFYNGKIKIKEIYKS